MKLQEANSPVKMTIYKIGDSVRGRPLLAVEIFQPEYELFTNAVKHKPEVRLMGNIHGNEDQGIFILVRS